MTTSLIIEAQKYTFRFIFSALARPYYLFLTGVNFLYVQAVLNNGILVETLRPQRNRDAR